MEKYHLKSLHQKSSLEIKSIQTAILEYYDLNGEKRSLPWRKPALSQQASQNEFQQRAYQVWVSEIMLQQTRVSKVKEYYEKWMNTFPTLSALANASLDEVHSLWSGLGYYSRATRLRESAIVVMNHLCGIIPAEAENIKKLPGCGPYTAGAISSIAFNLPTPLVDGNVSRLLSRLFSYRSDILSKKASAQIWEWAKLFVQDVSRPGDFNQALMDLGSLICTPTNPDCSNCPLQLHCTSRQIQLSWNELNDSQKKSFLETFAKRKIDESDLICTDCATFERKPTLSDMEDLFSPTSLPIKAPKKKPKLEYCYSFFVTNRTNEEKLILLNRNLKPGLLSNMWELPQFISENNQADENVEDYSRQIIKDLSCIYADIEIIFDKDVQTKSFVHKFSHIHRTILIFEVALNIRSDQYDIERLKEYTNKNVFMGKPFIWASMDDIKNCSSLPIPVTLRKSVEIMSSS